MEGELGFEDLANKGNKFSIDCNEFLYVGDQFKKDLYFAIILWRHLGYYIHLGEVRFDPRRGDYLPEKNKF